MRNDLFYSVKKSVKNWWIPVLVGTLIVILGIWCLITPLSTLIALTIVFAITFIVNGIFEIVFAISNSKILRGWGWTLVSGIINILFGIILVALPLEVLMIVFAYFVGFWIMFQSIMGIGASIELQRNGIVGWGWLLALAILGIIASMMFILSPLFASGFIVALVGISIIAFGIHRIYLGFKMRSLHKELEKMEKEDDND